MAAQQMIVDEVYGDDECICCQSRLAEVLLPRCKHRVLCADCFDQIRHNARRPRCPTCRVEIGKDTIPARYKQIHPTQASEADLEEGRYPYGTILDFSRPEAEDAGVQFADSETMRRVRAAVQEGAQGNVPLRDLREALQRQLSPDEIELAFVELHKDVDLHKTLVNIDSALCRRSTVWGEVARQIVVRTVEGHDAKAMAGRACLSSIGDIVQVGVYGIDSTKSIAGVNLLTNTVVCLLLVSIDVYRWSKGEITGAELACNSGENVLGTGAAALGSTGGAAAGAALGALCGPAAPAAIPVCTVLGALLGGFLADFIARKLYQQGVDHVCHQNRQSETEDEAKQRALNEAAEILGVDLQRDGFALAKSKFRRKVMAVHPDRARANNAVEDHEGAARIIASWQLVRLHYELREELDDGDGQKEPEAFISVWVMRARDSVQSAWHVTRTWFGEMENAPVHNGQLEKVERHKVYM